MKYLQDIAPLWNMQLRTGKRVYWKPPKLKRKQAIDITDYESCIVGEANGFDRLYHGCFECSSFAASLYQFMRPLRNGIKFYIELDDFIMHWNLKHV